MRILLVSLSVLLSSCASVDSLPQSSSEAGWGEGVGDLGWAAYADEFNVDYLSAERAYEIAKISLAENGFALKRGSQKDGMVIGEMGVTMQDWNTLAAFYYRPAPNNTKTQVRIVIEGSKDLGFTGDQMQNDYIALLRQTFMDYASFESSQPVPQLKDDCISVAQTMIENGLPEEAAKVLKTCDT